MNFLQTWTVMIMTMYKREVQYSSQYRRDYKKAKKQGKDVLLLILARVASHNVLDF